MFPAVQRYAIAQAEFEEAQRRLSHARRVMEYEQWPAMQEMKMAGVAPRQKIEGQLLGGKRFALFYDEAGIVML